MINELLITEVAETVSSLTEENGVGAIVVIGNKTDDENNNNKLNILALFDDSTPIEESIEIINEQISIERISTQKYKNGLLKSDIFPSTPILRKLEEIYCGYTVYDPQHSIKELRASMEDKKIQGCFLNRIFRERKNYLFYNGIYNTLKGMHEQKEDKKRYFMMP